MENILVVLDVLFAAVCGGFLRRWIDGWPKPPAGSVLNSRWPKILAAVALGFTTTVWFLPWWGALILAVALAVYWLPGHKLQEWSAIKWWHRYGPPGWYWWLANRLPAMPQAWHTANGCIDGNNAIAAFAAGATVYGLAAAVAALGAGGS